MKKCWYLSKPILLTALGKSADETFDMALAASQKAFSKNRKGYYVARYSTDDEDMLRGLLKDSIGALRESIEAVFSKVPADRVGLVLGNCDYFGQRVIEYHRQFAKTGSFSGYDISFQSPHKVADLMASGLGIKGPVFTVATACASSATAMARAADLIDSGVCDVVLAGGIDTSNDMIVDGFASLSAISPAVTNPFSRNRKGITLGDGAGYFFVSRERLFDFPVVMTGFGESSDGYNMTSPDPEAKAVMECLRKALRMAQLDAEDIDYINLHGTGTKANDSMEGLAVSSVFPALTPVSSTKALTGHTLAAAGAIELGLSALSIANGYGLPPHCYDGDTEEEATGLCFVPQGNSMPARKILSSSFAFGGANCAVILERCDA